MISIIVYDFWAGLLQVKLHNKDVKQSIIQNIDTSHPILPMVSPLSLAKSPWFTDDISIFTWQNSTVARLNVTFQLAGCIHPIQDAIEDPYQALRHVAMENVHIVDWNIVEFYG